MFVKLASSLVLVYLLCLTSARNVENNRIKRTTNDMEHSCENVKPFFQLRNISVQPFDPNKPKGPLCGGHCCNVEAETTLRMQGQKDFADLLRHNSRSLQGLINSTATALQDYVIELVNQSENRTMLLFSRMSIAYKDPINVLYGDIRKYIQINDSQDAFTTTDIDIRSSINRFFTDFFPLVYHHILKTLTKDFSDDYKACLRQAIGDVQPFGDIPRQLSQSLSKSLDATRLLFQAFNIGVEVLNSSDFLLTQEGGRGNVECHNALMKMTYCPKCLGLTGKTKPCSGYCLNVLRGCLSKYVTELDSPWNSYVEAVERLVIATKQHNNEAGVNAAAVIRELDTRISQAIMHAMEKEHEIDVRVKRICSSPKLANKTSTPLVTADTSNNSTGAKRLTPNTRVFAAAPANQFVTFLTSIAKSRGFYATLADNLCREESFAEPKDQHCWNGERIGEYTKTVVDAGLDMQKYNPEMKPPTNLQHLDPQIANLADKLRHVHQMVISSLGAASLPESDNFMQSDSADGSGSGAGPDIDDSEDIDPTDSGSGSGIGPSIKPTYTDINTRIINPNLNNNPDPSVPKQPEKGSNEIGAASLCRSSILFNLVLLLVAVIPQYY